MVSDADIHLTIITDCLSRMGGTPGLICGYEVLQGGISGSYTYLLDIAGEQAVLKATLAGSALYVLERARREVTFYRQMAGCIPLRVPRMLASYNDDTFGCCLLLAAYQPSAPPKQWNEPHYLEVAKQLGRFHATFWNKTSTLVDLAWLRKRQPYETAADVQHAYGYWQSLQNQPTFAGLFTTERMGWIDTLLKQIDALDQIIHALPATLCHGDCHIGNLLRDEEGHLRWADWQEVGLGCGPEDLSFFFQRAAAAGGTVPYERALDAYHGELVAVTGETISLAALRRAVEGSELRTRLLYWPAYLTQVSAEEMAATLQHIQELADRLELAT